LQQLLIDAQNKTADQALEYSQNALRDVSIALEEKLPANAEAREAGDEILVTFSRSLKLCDDAFNKNPLLGLETYIICVTSNKGMAMASLGELAGQQWAKSGASRPGLFC